MSVVLNTTQKAEVVRDVGCAVLVCAAVYEQDMDTQLVGTFLTDDTNP